jgi:hypothetical protein
VGAISPNDSFFKEESEMLLGRGQSMQVTGASKSGGIFYIDVSILQ